MKDTQRTKIFRVDAALNKSRSYPQLSSEQVNDLVAKVARSRWWKNRHGLTAITVEYGVPWCSGKGTRVVVAPNRTCVDVLHQMAHILTNTVDPPHNHEFASMYFKLLTNYLGQEVGIEIRRLFRAEKIKTSTWSPEARAAASERSLTKRFAEAGGSLARLVEQLGDDDEEG